MNTFAGVLAFPAIVRFLILSSSSSIIIIIIIIIIILLKCTRFLSTLFYQLNEPNNAVIHISGLRNLVRDGSVFPTEAVSR